MKILTVQPQKKMKRRMCQKPVIPRLTRNPLKGDCGSSLRYARNDEGF
jgi:hypothetical protein